MTTGKALVHAKDIVPKVVQNKVCIIANISLQVCVCVPESI